MKRFFAVLTAATLLFAAAACGSTEPEQTTASTAQSPSPTAAEEPPVTTTTAATTTTAKEPPATTTTEEAAEEADLSALELLGYQIGEEGEILVDMDQWQECEDLALFREYFFGTWENAEEKGINSLFVIDDSEKATLSGHWHFGGFYKIGENVLLFKVSGQVEASLFWLDIGDPDRMYREYAEGYARNQLVFREFQRENDHKTPVLTKTEPPPNEPEENFLSIYKLLELSRDRGMDLELLIDMEREVEIEYEGKKMTARLLHDDWHQFFPVYLVSESPDKLEFRTQVGNLLFENLTIGVRYTIEKINGEWVRTVEYDDEALSAFPVIRYQISDSWVVRFDADLWQRLEDYDLFREYFFGTWDYAENVMGYSPFVIDDSEKANLWGFGGFYEIDENVLAFTMWASAGGRLCWLDRNEPGRMYEIFLDAIQIHQYAWFNDGIAVLTKTDAPPNEPENNYLSRIRLRELSRKYGIDIMEMTYIHCETDREEDGKKTTVYMDADDYPKYLVSESPEKVVLKTQAGNPPLGDVLIDAWCTFEKVDGEWVRTVEFDGDVRLR